MNKSSVTSRVKKGKRNETEPENRPENEAEKVAQKRITARLEFCCDIFCVFFCFYFGGHFSESDKRGKQKKQTGTKNRERPAQLNKSAPKHYVYRDKGFAWNKKSILLCAMLVICTIT